MYLRFLDIANGEVLNIPDKDVITSRKNIVKYECNIKCRDVLKEVTCGNDVYSRGLVVATGDTTSYE
ncbi:hypothetical protein [Oceanirhabdus sp. W0125-5]|uniref:hypothetical protein n=1 Tax=Oceanirhabdus sp. W0125-5 TaxID=2999116 RepID=UPI0022F32B67|nr:hypothetical protein [Oceanirhabdus sp. W0125-5]WBW95458.1 hypothetical protein OW730_17405 [Oceanirhabdus sp. W0125-5]